MCRRHLFDVMSSLILPAREPGITSRTTTGPLQRAHLKPIDAGEGGAVVFRRRAHWTVAVAATQHPLHQRLNGTSETCPDGPGLRTASMITSGGNLYPANADRSNEGRTTCRRLIHTASPTGHPSNATEPLRSGSIARSQIAEIFSPMLLRIRLHRDCKSTSTRVRSTPSGPESGINWGPGEHLEEKCHKLRICSRALGTRIEELPIG